MISIVVCLLNLSVGARLQAERDCQTKALSFSGNIPSLNVMDVLSIIKILAMKDIDIVVS